MLESAVITLESLICGEKRTNKLVLVRLFCIKDNKIRGWCTAVQMEGLKFSDILYVNTLQIRAAPPDPAPALELLLAFP